MIDRGADIVFPPLLANAPQLTREVFGNIPGWSKLLFYTLAVVALVAFFYGCYRRARLWRQGQAKQTWPRLREVTSNLFHNVLLQRRVRGRGVASVAHICLFSGFVVLLIATMLIAIEHGLADLSGREPTDPVFHKGVYYAIYEVTTDAFGLVFLFGVGLLAWRRLNRPSSLGHSRLDWLVLLLLFTIGITGYGVEGLRIIREQTYQPGFSFVGLGAAQIWRTAGVDADSVGSVHFALWWIHAVCSLGFIAAIPYTRLRHFVAGTINLAVPAKQLGVMDLVTIDELEATGKVGVGNIDDMSQRQLLMLDACVSCGRCEEACPAFAANKPLSPKDIVQDLWGLLDRDNGLLHGDTISPDALWSCTTCSACVTICPLGISPLDMITDMRRFLLAEAELRGTAATSLQKLQRSGNPWGLPANERSRWAEGLDVPTVDQVPNFDVLYWVGCAAAYDRRTQKVARAVVRCLQAANVNFAVLGPEERCTGETARRLGDEFLFQELAEANISTLKNHEVKKIVTHCPHCLNSFKNDYPQLGLHVEVVHHSEFLAELIREGALRGELADTQVANDGRSQQTTFHDPCYLARVNGITESPRDVLQVALGADQKPIELRRNGCNTACCGAGGGRMWMDDTPQERIGADRIDEVLSTKAETLAVACPFCLKMFDDGLATANAAATVVDVAELLADRIAGPEERGD